MQRLSMVFPDFAGGRFRVSGVRVQTKERGVGVKVIAPAAAPTRPVGARVG